MHTIAMSMDDSFFCFGFSLTWQKRNRDRPKEQEKKMCKMKLGSNFTLTHLHLWTVLCSRNTCNLILFYMCVWICSKLLSCSTIIFRRSSLQCIFYIESTLLYVTCKLLLAIDELHKLLGLAPVMMRSISKWNIYIYIFHLGLRMYRIYNIHSTMYRERVWVVYSHFERLWFTVFVYNSKQNARRRKRKKNMAAVCFWANLFCYLRFQRHESQSLLSLIIGTRIDREYKTNWQTEAFYENKLRRIVCNATKKLIDSNCKYLFLVLT